MTPNERIAKELTGWEPEIINTNCPDEMRGCLVRHYKNSEPPRFDESLDACHLMEEKIKEKGWEENYIKALESVLNLPDTVMLTSEDYFKLRHASPLQLTTAAIRMLDEMMGEK